MRYEPNTVSVHGERGLAGGAERGNVMKAPFGRLGLRPRRVLQSSRLIWQKRHLELLQRKTQALAAGLDVSLLASPTGQERLTSLTLIETEQVLDLARGEELAGDKLVVCKVSEELDVDADLSVAAEREQDAGA